MSTDGYTWVRHSSQGQLAMARETEEQGKEHRDLHTKADEVQELLERDGTTGRHTAQLV